MAVRKRHLTFTILWALMILFLSVLPGQALPETKYNFLGADKVAHFIIYFFLTNSILKTFSFRTLNGPVIGYAFLISLLWGGLMEIMQKFLPINRSGDWRDLLANIAGSLLAIGWFSLVIILRRRIGLPLKKS